MRQCLAIPCIYSANHTPEIKNCHAPIVFSSRRFKIGNTYRKLSKAMRLSAHISGMLNTLVFPFVNPVNQAPGTQIGHSVLVIGSHRSIIKTLKLFYLCNHEHFR